MSFRNKKLAQKGGAPNINDLEVFNHLPLDGWGLYLNPIYGCIWSINLIDNIYKFGCYIDIIGPLIQKLFTTTTIDNIVSSKSHILGKLTGFDIGYIMGQYYLLIISEFDGSQKKTLKKSSKNKKRCITLKAPEHGEEAANFAAPEHGEEAANNSVIVGSQISQNSTSKAKNELASYTKKCKSFDKFIKISKTNFKSDYKCFHILMAFLWRNSNGKSDLQGYLDGLLYFFTNQPVEPKLELELKKIISILSGKITDESFELKGNLIEFIKNNALFFKILKDGQVKVNNYVYTDCMETTMRNILNALIYHNIIDKSELGDAFKEFYSIYWSEEIQSSETTKFMFDGSLLSARNAWAVLVSNNPELIYANNGCELQPLKSNYYKLMNIFINKSKLTEGIDEKEKTIKFLASKGVELLEPELGNKIGLSIKGFLLYAIIDAPHHAYTIQASGSSSFIMHLLKDLPVLKTLIEGVDKRRLNLDNLYDNIPKLFYSKLTLNTLINLWNSIYLTEEKSNKLYIEVSTNPEKSMIFENIFFYLMMCGAINQNIILGIASSLILGNLIDNYDLSSIPIELLKCIGVNELNPENGEPDSVHNIANTIPEIDLLKLSKHTTKLILGETNYKTGGHFEKLKYLEIKPVLEHFEIGRGVFGRDKFRYVYGKVDLHELPKSITTLILPTYHNNIYDGDFKHLDSLEELVIPNIGNLHKSSKDKEPFSQNLTSLTINCNVLFNSKLTISKLHKLTLTPTKNYGVNTYGKDITTTTMYINPIFIPISVKEITLLLYNDTAIKISEGFGKRMAKLEKIIIPNTYVYDEADPKIEELRKQIMECFLLDSIIIETAENLNMFKYDDIEVKN